MTDPDFACGHVEHGIGLRGYYGRVDDTGWTFCASMTELHDSLIRERKRATATARGAFAYCPACGSTWTPATFERCPTCGADGEIPAEGASTSVKDMCDEGAPRSDSCREARPASPPPPFPVDDFTLDQIEHALGGAYSVTEDGTHTLVGADFSLTQLLDFLSGFDPARLEPTDDPDTFVYDGAVYHEDDVIRALIAEVRRLRIPSSEGSV